MGVFTATMLEQRGVSRRAVQRHVAAGRLVRADRWYATADTDAGLLRVLRDGFRPTCVTAARHHGLWTPSTRDLHVYRPRTREHPAFVLHGWHERWYGDDPVAPVVLLLRHAFHCLDPVAAAILCESALHRGVLGARDLDDLLTALPRRLDPVVTRLDRSAESGTETKVRLFFALKGAPVRPQVAIPGVGRVDMVVGRRWIIECDSREFHTGEDSYSRDRRRDLRATAAGYLVTRLTYHQVFWDWERTVLLLEQILRSRAHRRPPG